MTAELTETPQNTDNIALSVIENLDLKAVQNQLKSIESFQNVVNKTLVESQDYGVIPGTNKPTLLKPGAEKILMILGLSSEYSIIDKVENYNDGFFAYTVEATLLKNGQLITQGMGSANTRETRYRQYTYINGKKAEWSGEYQDAYTLQNTVLKMAKKRAQVDATLTVASLSNVFTQDMEDNTDANISGKARNNTKNNGKNSDGEQTVITFGKYRGQTLEEIYQHDADYVKWLSKEARDLALRKAAAMILKPKESKKAASVSVHKTPSPELIAEVKDITNKIAVKEKITEEEVLKNNRVTTLESLTPEQCERLKKKLSKDLQNDSEKATEQPSKNTDIDLVDNDLPF